jgi:hypothetical protein
VLGLGLARDTGIRRRPRHCLLVTGAVCLAAPGGALRWMLRVVWVLRNHLGQSPLGESWVGHSPTKVASRTLATLVAQALFSTQRRHHGPPPPPAVSGVAQTVAAASSCACFGQSSCVLCWVSDTLQRASRLPCTTRWERWAGVFRRIGWQAWGEG